MTIDASHPPPLADNTRDRLPRPYHRPAPASGFWIVVTAREVRESLELSLSHLEEYAKENPDMVDVDSGYAIEVYELKLTLSHLPADETVYYLTTEEAVKLLPMRFV